MNNKIHSVRYNFIMNFLLTATNLIFPLVTFPYASRILQATGTGSVSFVTSVANYFAMVASLGIPVYGVRACAKVRDNKAELTKITHEIFIINSVMTLLSVATFIASIYLVPQFREEKALFYINAVNILLNLFGVNWLYQALEQYDYITIRSIAAKVISVVLMFILVKQQSDYVIYGAIGVFAAAGSNVLNLFRARSLVSFRPVGGYQLKRHIKPILTLFAQTMVISVYTNLDTVMLGFMKDNNEVGLYTTAVKVKTILLSLVSSLGSVLLPRMSNIVKNGDQEQFDALTKKALNFTLLMSVPLSAYFCLYAKESILLLAGEGFLGAVSAMQIITVALIPNGLTGILGVQVLTSLEKEKYVLYSVIVGAVSDLLLNLIFIPIYGAAGAAFATMIAEFLVLFVQMYYTRRIIGPLLRKLRLPAYVLSTACGAGVSLLIMHFILIISPFLRLLISASAFFLVYFVMLTVLREPIIWQYLDLFKTVLCRRPKPGPKN